MPTCEKQQTTKHPHLLATTVANCRSTIANCDSRPPLPLPTAALWKTVVLVCRREPDLHAKRACLQPCGGLGRSEKKVRRSLLNSCLVLQKQLQVLRRPVLTLFLFSLEKKETVVYAENVSSKETSLSIGSEAAACVGVSFA